MVAMRQRRKEDNHQVVCWIPHDMAEELRALAIEKGYVYDSGPHKGKPSLCKALVEVAKDGIEVRKQK